MPKNVFEINKNYIKELIQEAEVKLRTEQISRDNFTLYYSLFKVLADHGTNEIGITSVIDLGQALIQADVRPQELSGAKDDLVEDIDVLAYINSRK